MTDGFDLVPIWIENEGAIVIRMVRRPQAGPAIVLGAICHCDGVKRVDLRHVLAPKQKWSPMPGRTAPFATRGWSQKKGRSVP